MFPTMFTTTTRFLVLMVFCGCLFLSTTFSFADEAQLNLNTATAEQLEGLKGIGAELAQRIIEYRAENGPFKNVDELANVKGIGEGKLAKFRDLLTVEISAQPAKGSTGKGQ